MKREGLVNPIELKRLMKSEKPIVRVQMVDTPKNHHQIEEYIKFWSKIVEHVAVEDMLDWKADEEDDTPLQDWACAQLWQRLVVLADGDIIPCCRATRGGNEKLMVLGNAHTDSIEDIWKGDKLRQIRELHQKGESHKIKMCRFCGMRKMIVQRNKLK